MSEKKYSKKGFSITDEVKEKLDFMSKRVGKTKSRIAEEAILLLNTKYAKIYEAKENLVKVFGLNATINISDSVSRSKMGVTLNPDTTTILKKLSEKSGIPQSYVFEDAIKVMKDHQDLMYKRAKLIEELGDDAFLDFEEYMKNRKARQDEKNSKTY